MEVRKIFFASTLILAAIAYSKAALTADCLSTFEVPVFDGEKNILRIPRVQVGEQFFEADLVHNGNLNFTVTQAMPRGDGFSIYGVWETPPGGTLTLKSDGTYVLVETNECEYRGQPVGGIEAGRFTYDQYSELLLVTSVQRDENGDCGLAINGVPGDEYLIWSADDYLYVDTLEAGDGAFAMPRLLD
jgi:hypothetical protein